MAKWKVLSYETSDGVCEVEDFLNARKSSDRAKGATWIATLQEEGPMLPRPYADLLENGIHELRIKLSGDQVRTLYFFTFGDVIVLTHSFIKHSSKVPEKEIRKAAKIRDDFLKRYPKREALDAFF
ncbi:MAG: type II toxin-antitoxin system RelE/ParE family toxin [Fibrobacterota bacterium]|nr:type II toxin-antitoxin system RelE/ParE family toxin [Fibrobacterota bacterium]